MFFSACVICILCTSSFCLYRYGIYYLENWEAFALASSDPYRELLSRDGLLSLQVAQRLLGNVISFSLKTKQYCFKTRQMLSSSNLRTESVTSNTHLGILSASSCIARKSSVLYSEAVRASDHLSPVNGAANVSSSSYSQSGRTNSVFDICSPVINCQTVTIVKNSSLSSVCHAASDLSVSNRKSKKWMYVSSKQRWFVRMAYRCVYSHRQFHFIIVRIFWVCHLIYEAIVFLHVQIFIR